MNIAHQGFWNRWFRDRVKKGADIAPPGSHLQQCHILRHYTSTRLTNNQVQFKSNSQGDLIYDADRNVDDKIYDTDEIEIISITFSRCLIHLNSITCSRTFALIMLRDIIIITEITQNFWYCWPRQYVTLDRFCE